MSWKSESPGELVPATLEPKVSGPGAAMQLVMQKGKIQGALEVLSPDS